MPALRRHGVHASPLVRCLRLVHRMGTMSHEPSLAARDGAAAYPKGPEGQPTLPAEYVVTLLRGILAGRSWRRQMDRERGEPVFLTHARVKQYRDAIRACEKVLTRAL